MKNERDDGHTIDVGYVHVHEPASKATRPGQCVKDCPHPDHDRAELNT